MTNQRVALVAYGVGLIVVTLLALGIILLGDYIAALWLPFAWTPHGHFRVDN